MSSYRFCRTDDIGLLVDALNRCWLPYFPDDGPETAVTFKRSIRDLQVWCSSCMVAFSGSDPIGVLIGAKRPSGTLIHKLAIHTDHLRQGHGRHLLESLGSKLAILGPPRMVAEIPESLDAACALFRACGYTEQAVLTDYTLDSHSFRGLAQGGHVDGSIVIPVTVDDLAANHVLEQSSGSWGRSAETLTARKDVVSGLAAVSDEQIEAYILYIKPEILAVRTLVEDGGERLRSLLRHLVSGPELRFAKVHPAEISKDLLESLGFRPSGSRYRLFATSARAA